MAKNIEPPKTMTEAALRQSIRPETPEMENFLQAGYPMTVSEAKLIISEWEKDHKSWPLDEVRKASAFLTAYQSTPRVIDKTPAWKPDESED